jgi:hypothetical protein
MNDDQSRRLAMLGRVTAFRVRHTADFVPTSKGAKLLDEVAAAEAEATGGGSAQSSGKGAARAGTATKADLYTGLLDDLRAISASSKGMARDLPGVDERFRVPRSISQTNIINAARAFLADARPLEAEFIAHEMPTDFLADLEADILAYDAAVDSQSDGAGKQVAGTRTIAEAIRDGCAAVRDVGSLIRNKYRDNSPVLAEWYTASHVERTPRKGKVPTTGV